MTQKSHIEPRLEVRPGISGWRVYVTWPSGKTECVTGFNTQYQAADWIEHQSANWIVDKIMQEPGSR